MNERKELAGLDEYIQLRQGMELDEEQKNNIAKFIARLIGNMELNELISKNSIVMAIQSDAIADILDIPFHTRRLDELTFLNNAEAGYQKLLNGEKLNEDEKLSLRQFAIMNEIAALGPIFERLDNLDIINRNDDIKQFHDKVMLCSEITNYLFLKIKVESHPKLGFLISEFKRQNGLNITLNYFSAVIEDFVQKNLAQKPRPSLEI